MQSDARPNRLGEFAAEHMETITTEDGQKKAFEGDAWTKSAGWEQKLLVYGNIGMNGIEQAARDAKSTISSVDSKDQLKRPHVPVRGDCKGARKKI